MSLWCRFSGRRVSPHFFALFISLSLTFNLQKFFLQQQANIYSLFEATKDPFHRNIFIYILDTSLLSEIYDVNKLAICSRNYKYKYAAANRKYIIGAHLSAQSTYFYSASLVYVMWFHVT